MSCTHPAYTGIDPVTCYRCGHKVHIQRRKAYGVAPVTNDYTAPPRVQDALSSLLAALGFETMAKDVLDADKAAQRRYARVIEANWPEGERRREVVRSLLALNLL